VPFYVEHVIALRKVRVGIVTYKFHGDLQRAKKAIAMRRPMEKEIRSPDNTPL